MPYMLHTTYLIHSRQNKLLQTHTSFYVSCILFFLEMRRRAIANCIGKSRANIIHATQNIYNPFLTNHTSLNHTRPYTFLHVLLFRNEKESYRTCYRNKSKRNYHTCSNNTYTIHVRKSRLVTTHTSLYVLARSCSYR